MKTVLAVAWHVGGAYALRPVIEKLREEFVGTSWNVKCVVYGEAVKAWEGLEVVDLKSLGLAPNYSGAMDVLLKNDPKIVLTGTSAKDASHGEELVWEKQVIYAATMNGIPSVAVVDSWTNLLERFSNTQKGANWCFIPTKIAVPDQFAFDMMLDRRCPIDRLVATGNPHHDELYKAKKGFDKTNCALVKELFEVNPDSKFVTYFSTPVRDSYGSSLGYDEFSGLEDLLGAVKGKNCVVLVRLHPQERLRNHDKYDHLKSELLRIDKSCAYPTIPVVLASDVVCSTHSSVLVEAALMGKLAVSLQGGKFDDKPDYMEPFTTINAIVPVYDRSRTYEVLVNALGNGFFRETIAQNQCLLKLDGRNTERVLNLVYKTLALHS